VRDLDTDRRVVSNWIWGHEDVVDNRVLCWAVVNKLLDSIQGGKFLHQLSDRYLRKYKFWGELIAYFL
jgi:hypothetical protein